MRHPPPSHYVGNSANTKQLVAAKNVTAAASRAVIDKCFGSYRENRVFLRFFWAIDKKGYTSYCSAQQRGKCASRGAALGLCILARTVPPLCESVFFAPKLHIIGVHTHTMDKPASTVKFTEFTVPSVLYVTSGATMLLQPTVLRIINT